VRLKPFEYHERISHLVTGTWIYQTSYSFRKTARVKAMISSGKAVGFDPITDNYLKIDKNFRHLASYVNMLMTGVIQPTKHVNRARFMLLSKEKTSTPPIGRIRPIQMYSPLRKALEAVIGYIENEPIWKSISTTQAGARPNTMMWT